MTPASARRASRAASCRSNLYRDHLRFWKGERQRIRSGIAGTPKALRLMSPALRPIYERFLSGGLLLEAITEDLPYLDNRVLPSGRPSSDGRQRLRLQYRLHASEIERRGVFLRQLKQVFEPFHTITLRTGKDNAVLTHISGTCRFGADPKTSVLDPQNRAHEVDNLYVVDTSFYPSSTRINPGLTIAANALRVAAHVNQVHFAA